MKYKVYYNYETHCYYIVNASNVYSVLFVVLDYNIVFIRGKDAWNSDLGFVAIDTEHLVLETSYAYMNCMRLIKELRIKKATNLPGAVINNKLRM